jgi:hypothetical protein
MPHITTPNTEINPSKTFTEKDLMPARIDILKETFRIKLIPSKEKDNLLRIKVQKLQAEGEHLYPYAEANLSPDLMLPAEYSDWVKDLQIKLSWELIRVRRSTEPEQQTPYFNFDAMVLEHIQGHRKSKSKQPQFIPVKASNNSARLITKNISSKRKRPCEAKTPSQANKKIKHAFRLFTHTKPNGYTSDYLTSQHII